MPPAVEAQSLNHWTWAREVPFIFFEVYIKSSNFSSQAFRKRAVLVSNHKGEKLETFVWRIVARYWKKLEAFRI